MAHLTPKKQLFKPSTGKQKMSTHHVSELSDLQSSLVGSY